MKRMDQSVIDATLELIKSQERATEGNERIKEIVNRLLKSYVSLCRLDIRLKNVKACDWNSNREKTTDGVEVLQLESKNS